MTREGTVEVDGETFVWSVVDGEEPTVIVSHPDYGCRSEPKTLPGELIAKLIAKEMLAQKRGP